jgi:hypothetical protein
MKKRKEKKTKQKKTKGEKIRNSRIQKLHMRPRCVTAISALCRRQLHRVCTYSVCVSVFVCVCVCVRVCVCECLAYSTWMLLLSASLGGLTRNTLAGTHTPSTLCRANTRSPLLKGTGTCACVWCCYSVVTVLLQWFYGGVTVVLQWCYSSVTVV